MDEASGDAWNQAALDRARLAPPCGNGIRFSRCSCCYVARSHAIWSFDRILLIRLPLHGMYRTELVRRGCCSGWYHLVLDGVVFFRWDHHTKQNSCNNLRFFPTILVVNGSLGDSMRWNVKGALLRSLESWSHTQMSKILPELAFHR